MEESSRFFQPAWSEEVGVRPGNRGRSRDRHDLVAGVRDSPGFEPRVV